MAANRPVASRWLALVTVTLLLTLPTANICLGQDDKSWSSLNGQGLAQYRAGNYSAALDSFRRALKEAELLGLKDRRLAVAYTNLGLTLASLNQLDEANEQYQRARVLLEESEPESVELRALLNNLGQLAIAQGRLQEAETFLRRAIELEERFKGPNSPGAAAAVNNLGIVFTSLGRGEDALEQYEKARQLLDGAKVESLLFATVLQNVGVGHLLVGRLDDAERELERSREMFRKVAPMSPSAGGTLSGLGSLYLQRGELVRAEGLLQGAVALMQRALGADHPELAGTLMSLGEAERRLEKLGEAEQHLQRAVRLWEVRHPDGDTDTARMLNSLALVYQSQGRAAEAEPLFRRALDLAGRFAGEESEVFLTVRKNLTEMLLDEGGSSDVEPLLRASLAASEKVAPDATETAQLANKLGIALYRQEKHGEASVFFRRAAEIWAKLAGHEVDARTAVSNASDSLGKAGRHAEAEVLVRWALRELRPKLGPESAEAGLLVNELGVVLDRQGKPKEAEAAFLEAYAIYEKLENAGPNRVVTLGNIAWVHWNQEDYAGAEPWFRRALAESEKVYGAESTEISEGLTNLADTLEKLEKGSEAEELYGRLLAIHESLYGVKNIELVGTLDAVAGFYARAGNRPEVEEGLRKRLFSIVEEARGAEHKETLDRLHDLAIFYEGQERYNNAEVLYERLEAGWRKVSEEHPLSHGHALMDLGNAYRLSGQPKKAEPLLLQAVELTDKAEPLGDDVVAALDKLATLYEERERYGEAESTRQRILEIHLQVEGEEGSSVAEALTSLGDLASHAEQNEKAEGYYRRALDTRRKNADSDPAAVGDALWDLARTLVALKRPAEAEPLYREAADAYRKQFGEEHTAVANVLNQLGKVLDELGRFEDAEPVHRRALAIDEKILEATDVGISMDLTFLGNHFTQRKNYSEAEQFYKRALEAAERAQGEWGEQVAEVLEKYATMLREVGRDAEAAPLEERARAIRRKKETGSVESAALFRWEFAAGALVE